jgi:diguanylate cyclase (GGDEF)-like protein/PAS domain S-box-containing protein
MEDRSNRVDRRSDEEFDDVDGNVAINPPAAPVRIGSTDSLPSWLKEHPDALVGAVDRRGGPVAMPQSVPLGPGHQTDERSLLELVVPEDSRAVADAFVAALSRGVGVARIRMASEPERPLLLQYLDLQDEHGILLRTVVPADALDGDVMKSIQLSAFAPVRPRLALMTKDEVASILSIDSATTLMLGWAESDMMGHSTLEFIHPDDHVRAIDNWMSRLSSDHGSTAQTVRLRYLCKDGAWLWLETSNDFQDRDDGTTVVVAKLIDISGEMAAIEALRRNERFLRMLTDAVPVGLFHIGEGGVVEFVNPVLSALIGNHAIETLADLTNALEPDQDSTIRAAIESVLASGTDADIEISAAVHDDGSHWSYRISLQAVTDGTQVLGVLGCVVDVTKLRTLADTDVLTGLHNRRWIVEILETDLIEHAGRVSVIFVDLDDFKSVNDRHGHHVGDEVLVAVADRLRTALRPTDRIGRIGGDEFLVICPGLGTRSAALDVARRLQESLHQAFELPEVTLQVSASFGAGCGRAGTTVDELISLVDTAMYDAKAVKGGPPKCLSRDA